MPTSPNALNSIEAQGDLADINMVTSESEDLLIIPDPGSLADLSEDTPDSPSVSHPSAPLGTQDQVDAAPERRGSAIDDINIALKFVDAIKEASLDNKDEPIDKDILQQICNPATTALIIEDANERLSIDIYLALTTASEAAYTAIRTALLRRDPTDEILTYYKVKQLIAGLTGIVPLVRDMCINSCVGYTGPFAKLDNCPECAQARYEPRHLPKKIARKQFQTFPLALQLQALWRTVDGAHSMGYRQRYTTLPGFL